MKRIDGIGLKDVRQVYSGPEGRLWELIMGEQIHIGGFVSSMDLAQKADIAAGTNGVDLCCCTGAGMRFLIRTRNVAAMTGVDATQAVVEQGYRRCQAEGLADRIDFVLADVCNSGLESDSADFVWGEDAWCYVEDKPQLIAEAARIARPDGTIAFTDWIEGPAGLSDEQAERFLKFMKFPNVEDLDGYRALLEANGCEVVTAADTGRFAPCVDLYLDMVGKQLGYDVLKIIGFDKEMFAAIAGEMQFMQRLAHDGRIAQGIFIARKKD
jgi:SAM-dependent methyltransferase